MKTPNFWSLLTRHGEGDVRFRTVCDPYHAATHYVAKWQKRTFNENEELIQCLVLDAFDW